jgi:hypothetical protein
MGAGVQCVTLHGTRGHLITLGEFDGGQTYSVRLHDKITVFTDP